MYMILSVFMAHVWIGFGGWVLGSMELQVQTVPEMDTGNQIQFMSSLVDKTPKSSKYS